MQIRNDKFVHYMIVGFLMFIAGTIITPIVAGFFDGAALLASKSDPASAASVYISYTTLLFAGFTIFLAITSIYFAYQFSIKKEDLLSELRLNLMKRIAKDEIFAMEVVMQILDIDSVKKILETRLDELTRRNLSSINERDVRGGKALNVELEKNE